MGDLLRRIGSFVFGWKWVEVIDFDGEVNVRRVFFRGASPCIQRHNYLPETIVFLHDDGGCVCNMSYVASWRPLNVNAKKELPRYRGSAAQVDRQCRREIEGRQDG